LNSSLQIKNNNELQQKIFRSKDIFASPQTNIETVIGAIGCHTSKSGGGFGNKSFNLKIKLKNESTSFKKLKLSTNKKASEKTVIIRSSTKDILNHSNLSAPREAYNSTAKINSSAIEASNIIDEKMSDMSFSLNFNEIIGSMDEKSEMRKMKSELQQKDDCI
jgi:hypothetical protein